MDKKDLRIVFLGTPDFAVASLSALIEANYTIVGVITMPDKPAGRGHQLQESAVKKYAISQNLKVLQPTNLKDEGFINELKSLNPNLQIVVAFRMLPEMVWNMPSLGTINLHGSLLPQYRGAAPINWAIINGETETGVTTFFLKQEIDTGNIILQQKIKIEKDDNAGIVYERLMKIGGHLIVKTCDLIYKGNYPTYSQQELALNFKELKPAPKIFKETCHINWNQPTNKIYNLIRGLSPYPAAWFKMNQNNKEYVVKIYEAKEEFDQPVESPGKIITDNKTFLKISTIDGYINIAELQLSGKKKMAAKELLCGFNFVDCIIV